MWLNLEFIYMQASNLSLFYIFLQWKNYNVLTMCLTLGLFIMKCSTSVFFALLLKQEARGPFLTGRSAPGQVFHKQDNQC